MRIGLLTDTHGSKLLFDEIKDAFANVDLILHGGDIYTPAILDWLEKIAPVLAAKGNGDIGWDDPRVSHTHILAVEGWRLGMIHDLEPEDRPLAELAGYFPKPVDIMVSGHTHFERLEYREGVLLMNTGSAVHPHQYSTRLGTIGILDLQPGKLDARIIRLGETPEKRNPGTEHHIHLG